MHHFHYKNGVLHAEDVSIARLAAEVGTPFYCYSTATLERHYRVLGEAFAGLDCLICFAVKANPNQAVLATMARLGAGMDVVSEGENRGGNSLPLRCAAALYHSGQLVDHRFQLVGLGGQLPRGGG